MILICIVQLIFLEQLIRKLTSKCGTPIYYPPEIVLGQPYDYGVDLWCLGCVSFEMLVGEHPFDVRKKVPTEERILK